ncbi:hypothetical protein [Rugamonas aquatica]|uniref:EscE/YscE/SsaE family type III secretion system needle protein co-chaperone n=1 Tax=Rugamonas aquatica TaxID=2743357 RepID=A0A6A7N1Q5_9BURK|nr:hypothetical protein [Rugamonas aquatica]MQA38891.1 hypothetical protein [Rugamonas aquatica]
MPFKELNAQMQLVDELIPIRDKLQSLLMTNPVLNDQRYRASKVNLEKAMHSIISAADAIGYTPRQDE